MKTNFIIDGEPNANLYRFLRIHKKVLDYWSTAIFLT